MNPWGGRGPAIPIPRKRYLRAAAGRTNFPSAAPRARRQIFFWLLLLSAERGRVSTYGGNRYVAAAHSFFGNGPRCRRYVPRNVATPAIRRFRRITAGDLCGPGRLRPPTPQKTGSPRRRIWTYFVNSVPRTRKVRMAEGSARLPAWAPGPRAPGGGGVIGSGGDCQACGGRPLRPDLDPLSRQRPAPCRIHLLNISHC